MNRSSLVAALAGALLFGSVASAQTEDEPARELLPFSRQIAVSGTVAESLEASIADVGRAGAGDAGCAGGLRGLDRPRP